MKIEVIINGNEEKEVKACMYRLWYLFYVYICVRVCSRLLARSGGCCHNFASLLHCEIV